MANLMDLKAKFRSLEARIGLKLLRRAGRSGGELIRERAATLAPMRTGRLRRTMAMRTRKEDSETIEIEIGPAREAWYGRFQDTGTAHHPAQPFLNPAADQMKVFAAEAFAKDLLEEVESALS